MIYEEKLIQCSIVTPKGVLKDVPCDLVLKDPPGYTVKSEGNLSGKSVSYLLHKENRKQNL